MLYVAATFAFVMAVLPNPPQPPGAPSDKVQHIIAFITLGAIAALAYPQVSIVRLVIVLAVFGGAIELIQAVPALHRDSDVVDFAFDVMAALVAAWTTRWVRARFND